MKSRNVPDRLKAGPVLRYAQPEAVPFERSEFLPQPYRAKDGGRAQSPDLAGAAYFWPEVCAFRKSAFHNAYDRRKN
jgi:hypothetical protein